MPYTGAVCRKETPAGCRGISVERAYTAGSPHTPPHCTEQMHLATGALAVWVSLLFCPARTPWPFSNACGESFALSRHPCQRSRRRCAAGAGHGRSRPGQRPATARAAAGRTIVYASPRRAPTTGFGRARNPASVFLRRHGPPGCQHSWVGRYHGFGKAKRHLR